MENEMIEKAKELVSDLLKNDNSGHGMEHILRVYDLCEKFAKNENCNKEIVLLSALLHDADDYKLFGEQNQKELTNTNKILNELNISENTKQAVLEIVATIGYSKRLKGICPTTIEGKIVSDADMCDALGANGILRVYLYEIANNKPFFDKNVWPIENMNTSNYNKKCSDSAVCHIFEKILKLKNLMLTSSGTLEATQRHNFVINFLKQLFYEENTYNWLEYLDNFLKH